MFFGWEWRDTRRMRRAEGEWSNEMGHPDGRPVGGLVLCDYVDEQKLASIAKQKGVEA